ncbi:MAG: PTS sugar transporter subunit IIA [Propioniciclava sp.]|uniref:PTS sugar transporter subunit IIA n=1 Tax=Propioniciclava sp. TaxID=2038686 RepID=UPI0039E29B2A
MVTVIIAAHGHLAPALIDSSQMIMGEQDGVKAVTFDTTEGPDDLLAKYADAAEGETLLLVDFFGGSPYNAAARFAANREGTDIVTGVSLAMLIEVLGKRRGNADLAKLVATAKKAGAVGVRVFSEVYKPAATTTEDSDEGDEL